MKQKLLLLIGIFLLVQGCVVFKGVVHYSPTNPDLPSAEIQIQTEKEILK